MIRNWLIRQAAKRLAKHGSHTQRQRILSKAAQIREELGLSPDPRLRKVRGC